MTKNNNKPMNTQAKWWLLAISVLCLFVYSSSFKGAILNFDDNQYFEDYPDIVNLSWENVGRYFTEHYVIMYHPLPILSFAIQYHLHGLNPAPFHYFNFIFHLINILLVFKLAQRLLKNNLGALLVALIFAVHPMNTEAVSWISARSSIMYTCFFLASILAYIRYINTLEKTPVKWYFISILFALLSFFSKANALPLPVVLLLFDWFYARKFSPKLILEKLPFFAIAIAFGLKALSDSGTANNLSLGASQFNFFEGLLLSAYTIWHYITHFFVPHHLSAIHTYPIKTDNILPIIYYISPLILAALALFLFKNRQHKFALFGLFFFVLVVSVTLQIIPSRLFLMADRYVYLPYVGFALVLVFYTLQLLDNKNIKLKKYGNYGVASIILWCLVLSATSYNRNKIWNNTFDLVTDIIEKNNEDPYIARAYGIRALEKENMRDARGAILDYNKAIEIRPTDGETYYNRGRLYFGGQQFEKAQNDFERAQKILGNHHTLLNYLGGCAFNLGNIKKALEYYTLAVAENPKYAEAWRNKGASNASLQNFAEAENDFNKAIELQSNEPENYRLRGILYLKLNNGEKACKDLSRAKLLGAKGVDELLKINNCSN